MLAATGEQEGPDREIAFEVGNKIERQWELEPLLRLHLVRREQKPP